MWFSPTILEQYDWIWQICFCRCLPFHFRIIYYFFLYISQGGIKSESSSTFRRWFLVRGQSSKPESRTREIYWFFFCFSTSSLKISSVVGLLGRFGGSLTWNLFSTAVVTFGREQWSGTDLAKLDEMQWSVVLSFSNSKALSQNHHLSPAQFTGAQSLLCTSSRIKY